ncbi:hypothetical protein N7481_011903 [Penicillium waksmanii]|uniref:uncharacterized protein n=1 Tax=Penicillium waksmanii TaxID=69791 RepID=UPI0025491650|nr:uncharacterized protein N7481_011903 [Penicillium waksmanii]KAJ5974693.1 hypothetical protein N7481_011903 [Penicillium waksmanii]
MEKADYFIRFPAFQRAPMLSSNSEFSLLAREMNWKKDSRRYRKERANFLASEFNIYYGSNATKLENWQALCVELDISDSIGSITQCRKALGNVHVNLVDLVDCRRNGQTARRFPSVAALQKYTKKTDKIFPRSAAKEDGFLKALLRVIY